MHSLTIVGPQEPVQMGSETENRAALLRILQYRWPSPPHTTPRLSLVSTLLLSQPAWLNSRWRAFSQIGFHLIGSFPFEIHQLIFFFPHVILLSSYPHAESIFSFPSWYPAVPSLGEKQEVFLHEGEVGKVLSKWRWRETLNQTKSAPLWRRYSASRLQPKKCEMKKTILQYHHQTHFLLLSSYPYAILAVFLLLIVIRYIWKI